MNKIYLGIFFYEFFSRSTFAMGFSKQQNNDNRKKDLSILLANNSRSNKNAISVTKYSSRSVKTKKNMKRN